MRVRRSALAVVAGFSALALVGFAFHAPRQAAAGWLMAFAFLSAIPLGSLALLMVHRLTGGCWGESLRPALEPAAACTVLLAALLVPVFVALPLLYPWVQGSEGITASVARFYLNVPLFVLRSVLAFAGWIMLAFMLPRAGERSGLVLAGVGLVFHAIAVSLLSVDWILSVEPAFISNSFGATVAFVQIYAALACGALFAPNQPIRHSVSDLGGLMLTVALGITYINFMAVLVIWYGDLPHKVDWFVERAYPPWNYLAIGAFVLGSVIPIVLLLWARVRRSMPALRWIGAVVLLAVAVYDAWLLAPAYGTVALGATLPAAAVIACGLLLFATGSRQVRLSHRWRTAHG